MAALYNPSPGRLETTNGKRSWKQYLQTKLPRIKERKSALNRRRQYEVNLTRLIIGQNETRLHLMPRNTYNQHVETKY